MNQLIMVTKTGIVNVFEIKPDRGGNFIQLIHGEDIKYKIIDLNPNTTLGDDLRSPEITKKIKDYKSIYFNNVKLVDNGWVI